MDTKGSNIPAIERATGRSWAEWVALIDAAGGRERPHPEIARVTHALLDGVIDSSGWWAQGVAIAYEQHIGRRLPGQSPDGTFQVSASRTLPDDPLAARARWTELLAENTELRAAGAEAVRLTETAKRANWRVDLDDGGRIQAEFTPKPDGRAQLQIQHSRIPDAEQGARWKTFWKARASEL